MEDKGVIRLAEIYEFIKRLSLRRESYILKGCEFGKAYGEVCTALAGPKVLPRTSGFYLWGFYDKSRFWVNVYLGKAGNEVKGNFAHLQWRIREN